MKKQALKQKQTDQEPQDIGKLNSPNLMLWTLKNASGQTTVKKIAKEIRHL